MIICVGSGSSICYKNMIYSLINLYYLPNDALVAKRSRVAPAVAGTLAVLLVVFAIAAIHVAWVPMSSSLPYN